MIRRALGPLVLAAVVLAWAAPAHAGKTYCISGFEPGADYGAETGAKTQQDACSDSCFRGSGWHQHGFLRKNGQCYSCWDENDNTCKDLAEADGYTLISLQSCEGAPIVSPQDEPGSCYPDTPPPPPKPDPPPDPPPDDTSQQPPPRQPDPPPEPVAPPPIKLKAPPPPRPTDYDGVIVSIGPGPYAVNTPIRVVGGAKTRAGKVRRVPRGDFVVLGPDGQEVARVHGKPKGRGVVADVTIPVGGAITIRFEPKSVITSPGESLASISPADQQIQVAGCRVQAQLDAPTHGEILVADAQAALRGHFVDAGGQPASAAALSGAHARFLVEIAGEEQRLDAAVDDAGVATASVLIAKPASASEVVRISLIAEGGAGDVCPSSPIEARVTALGVGIEITADVRAGAGEAHCYVDRPCAVTARFRLPTDPTARALGEQFVRSAGLVMTASAGGAPGPLTADRPGELDAIWRGTIIPGDVGDVALIAVATSARGQAEDQAALHVEEPIELRLPTLLDLGTVAAGTASNQRCAALDLSTSRGVRYQRFRLSAPRPSGCDSYPVVFAAASGVGFPLHGDGGVTVEIDDTRAVTICLAAIPRCADEAPAPLGLTVAAVNPDFPDQQAQVELRWRVSGRSLLACWWWLIAAVGGALVVLVVGYGFVRPWRFAVDDQVQLAGKREQLARAVGRRLRDLPGGRPGWYRSAAVGLVDGGQATARLRTALVELHARRGEVVIRSRGGLQRVSPQSKKLEPVAEAATKDGHVASKNVVYAAGALFFQLK